MTPALSLQDLDLPDLNLATAAPTDRPADADDSGDARLADYFRDTEAAGDSPWAGRIEAHGALIDALRALFHGPAGLVRLRLWVFMTLVEQGNALFNRDEIDALLHALRPDALDTVLKRLRESGLLAWDDTQRRYQVTPLAQQLTAVLSPLATASPADGELAGLLGQVIGAEQLGTLDVNQIQMLQAQLVRLHAEFSDAIASGSEFRLREARKRYERAATLIDRASDTIAAIIHQSDGHAGLEKAARALGQAQSRLLAMASQFNRALQQVDRQRVTLGTTGITSTDVKRWLQTLPQAGRLLDGALASGLIPAALAPHDLLDVTEAEFERDRPQAGRAESLPPALSAPQGSLAAVALPRELGDLAELLGAWATGGQAGLPRPVAEALLGPQPARSRYAQVAYKTQLLPLLGDAQARELPGATGALARQPWRVQWQAATQAIDHDEIELLSQGQLVPAADTPAQPPDKTP